MKFLSVRELKAKSSQVWRDLSLEKEMIVTSNGYIPSTGALPDS